MAGLIIVILILFAGFVDQAMSKKDTPEYEKYLEETDDYGFIKPKP